MSESEKTAVVNADSEITGSEITVRITPSRPLHLATGPGSNRYALDSVRIEPRSFEGVPGVICAATDSRILVVSKEEGTAKQCDLVPAACFSAKKNEEIEAEKNGQWVKRTCPKAKRYGVPRPVTEVTLPIPVGRFPTFRSVLPDVSSGSSGEYLVVSLDPEVLLTLAKAMGGNSDDQCHAITLLIPIKKHIVEATDESPGAELPFCNSAIAAVLFHPDKGTSVGVIMPCESSPTKERDDYTRFVASLGPTPLEIVAPATPEEQG